MTDIVDAARQVFMRKGYKRTQVADVAKEVGISPAALYRHVEGKEALFHLCFVDEAPGANEYVSTPPDGATLELIRAQLDRVAPLGRVTSALRTPTDDPAAELAEIIVDFYRTVQHHWQLLALVEASAHDWPDLSELFFRQGRRKRTNDLARYIRLRIEDGSFRSVESPELVALQIREACAWFAWHRRGDPDTPPLDDDKALASIVDLYVNGLLAV
jgi:AcrR family transcriptional regulator